MARASPVRTERHGRVCLFRFDADALATDDERHVPAVGNILEIEGDAELPDGNTWYTSCKGAMSRIDTRNPAPFAENTPRPDTGFDGLRVEMNLLFDERERKIGRTGNPLSDTPDKNNMAKGLALLRDWFREDNSIRGKYRHGRIGMRNDYRPEFNVVPDNYGGYKLVHLETDHDLDVPYYIRTTIILQYAGAPGQTEVAGDNKDRLGDYDERQTSAVR